TDQARVYAMIMHSMSPQVVLPNNGLPAAVTAPVAAAATEPVTETPRRATYPPAYGRLLAPAAPPAAPKPQPDNQAPTTAATEPTAVASQPAREPEAVSSAAASTTSRTLPTTWPIHPPIANVPLVTDAQVQAAILRGVDFLISQFDAGGEVQHFAGEGEI